MDAFILIFKGSQAIDFHNHFAVAIKVVRRNVMQKHTFRRV